MRNLHAAMILTHAIEMHLAFRSVPKMDLKRDQTASSQGCSFSAEANPGAPSFGLAEVLAGEGCTDWDGPR